MLVAFSGQAQSIVRGIGEFNDVDHCTFLKLLELSGWEGGRVSGGCVLVFEVFKNENVGAEAA